MSYSYPGSELEFYEEFGGLPKRGVGIANGFLIVIIIIVIMFIILGIVLYLSSTTDTFIDHEGYFNLDNLLDLNVATAECCVQAGDTVPNELYLYDTTTNITYSRDVPLDINTVCNSFPDPAACISANTDSEGNVIPFATFKAQPYYTFENGLFIICDSTAACN